jgi:YidC/Oxa1 family membrane protein insertase
MDIFTTVLIQPLANGLVLFYRLLGGNMGLAIIGFSLFLRGILSPLTRPYMESMKKMREYAPQLEKLKNKHKGDKAKLAQAQADFYKNKGINPGAGCLPYLLQIIVLIAFFNVFRRTLMNGDDLVANFNLLLYDPLKFAVGDILNTKFLYLDITKPDVINLSSVDFSVPGPILFLAALVQLVSAKVTAAKSQVEKKIAEKTPETGDDMQVAMQQSMIYVFPFFTLFIGMRFASGLALYWLVFSATQAYQQIKSQGLFNTWRENLKTLKSGVPKTWQQKRQK